jgi:hypothetical protein
MALVEVYSDDNSRLLLPSDGKENVNDNNAMIMGEETNEETQSTDNSSQQKMSSTESLHYDSTKSSNKELFLQAYSILGAKKNEKVLNKGLQLAVEIQQTIALKAFAMIDGNTIQRLHRIYYTYLSSSSTRKSNSSSIINNGTSSSSSEKELMFGRPNVLYRLGQFIMEVKVSKLVVFLFI